MIVLLRCRDESWETCIIRKIPFARKELNVMHVIHVIHVIADSWRLKENAGIRDTENK